MRDDACGIWSNFWSKIELYLVGKVQVDAIRARLKGAAVDSGLGRKDESEWVRDLGPVHLTSIICIINIAHWL